VADGSKGAVTLRDVTDFEHAALDTEMVGVARRTLGCQAAIMPSVRIDDRPSGTRGTAAAD
jgi:hypothetical protein